MTDMINTYRIFIGSNTERKRSERSRGRG